MIRSPERNISLIVDRLCSDVQLTNSEFYFVSHEFDSLLLDIVIDHENAHLFDINVLALLVKKTVLE